MSNLLKYNHVVVKNEDKHVIDSNELLKNILSANKNTTSGNSFAEKSIPDPDGFVRGIDAARVEKLISDEEEQQDDNNAGILEDARKQAEDILEDAIIENRQAIEMAKIYSDILNGTMEATKRAMKRVPSNQNRNQMTFRQSLRQIISQ